MGVKGAERALTKGTQTGRVRVERRTLQDWERRSSVASERVTSLWDGGYQPVHTGGAAGGSVCAGAGGGVHLFPWEWVGGFHCVTETLVNISLRLPRRKQQHRYTSVHVKVAKSYKTCKNTGSIIWGFLWILLVYNWHLLENCVWQKKLHRFQKGPYGCLTPAGRGSVQKKKLQPAWKKLSDQILWQNFI